MSPLEAYHEQARHAEERGIKWFFSYADWLEMWLLSGKWFERGKRKNQYCMCRYGDTGPYSTRNCYIGTVEQNQRDRWDLKEKITNEKAREIAELYLGTNATQRELAAKYGVDQSYISRIISKVRKRNA